MKRVLSILLAVSLILSVFGVSTYAEDAKSKIYIADTQAYAVEKDETKIIVPIYIDGSIDMQCYDITVTFDKTMLDVVAEETYITLPDNEHTYGVVNTGTDGSIRFAGMTVEESAKTSSGRVGQIVFTSAKRVAKDGITTDLTFAVAELGFGTEVADIEVDADATVTLNKSDPPVTVTLGDVNADTVIDAADALAVLKHAAKLEMLEGDALAAANVDANEVVDSSDALQILKYAAGLISEF